MKLIVISPPEDQLKEIKNVLSLFDAGLERFHLRKPNSSEQSLVRFIEAIPSEFHPRIVLHSFHHLAEQFALGGIHLKIPSNLHPSKSCSVHSLTEIEFHSENYDYLFLSPVFDSISKVGYKTAFTKNELERFLKIYNTSEKQAEIIALGGICLDNIPEAADMGFNGVAVLGALWQQPEQVLTQFNLMKSACDKFLKYSV
jgi:thiamine-phosphate pyrophosphorylase